MTKRILLIFIILLIIALIGAAIASGISLQAVLSRVPGAEKFIKTTAPVTSQIPVVVSPVEEENQKLKNMIKELESRITSLESEKTGLMEQSTLNQQELIELRAYKNEREKIIVNSKQLASYYQEMKPEAVAKIMNNLDDDTVLLILPLLEKEQTAKILSLLDPQRAALITRILLGQNDQ